jgi:hypothetical protein
LGLLRGKTCCSLALLFVGACASGEAIEAMSSGELDGGGVGGASGAGSGGDSGSSGTGGASSGGSGGTFTSGGSSGSGGGWPDGGGTGGSSGSWPTGGSAGDDASGGSGGNGTGGTSVGTGGGGTTGGTGGATGTGGSNGAAGSGGTSACTPPLVDCGGTCVDTSSNPQHCNTCNNACGAAPNSTPSCSAGACGYSCNAGFAQVGSKCTTFGGAFAGPGPGCGNPACKTANPYSGGCGCPANFAPIGPFNILDDSRCPNNNPPFGWESIYICAGGAFSATADFGGGYQREGSSCKSGNPWSAGSCSCPAPSIAIELIADGGCWNDTHVGVCWNPSATMSTFGGAYQRSDSASYGNAGCVVGNPATGGACSCPGGTTEIAIRNIYGPGNAGCEANGAIGGQIYICRSL